jgi:spermidine synthase
MTKKIFSYVLPQKIKEGVTSLGQHYEINFENGVKVLNSENTNYSFGSLHQIMQKGIDEVLKTHQPKKILMLGLGAGSALHILNKKCKWDFEVVVVELDGDLIDIAKEEFELNKYNNVEILHNNAELAVSELNAKSFDLVIDDVFWDNQVPAFCLSEAYLQNCSSLLRSEGVYMRNIMADASFKFKTYEAQLKKNFNKVNSMLHAVYGNKIYFCQNTK